MTVEVLRLGHRPGRDERLTSHVALTARAFGADRVHVAGAEDSQPIETVDSIVDRFGGEFQARQEPSPRKLVNDWSGTVVHLTMYGLPVQDVVDDVRDDGELNDGGDGLLVAVGSRKVHGWMYDLAGYNVAVTNQPHSEVAALAVFLHMYLEGDDLQMDFPGGEIEVIPSDSGKNTREPDEGP